MREKIERKMKTKNRMRKERLGLNEPEDEIVRKENNRIKK